MFVFTAANIGLGVLSTVLSKKKVNKDIPKREIRMCVLGLDNAGKTTILKAIAKEEI